MHYIDWLADIRPSFTPPRLDLRSEEPGAAEVFSQRLDSLNTNYESLVQLLSQRLKTAIEVNGAEGLVSILSSSLCSRSSLSRIYNKQSFAETLQRPLRTYRFGFTIGGSSTDEPDQETFTSYSKTE